VLTDSNTKYCCKAYVINENEESVDTTKCLALKEEDFNNLNTKCLTDDQIKAGKDCHVECQVSYKKTCDDETFLCDKNNHQVCDKTNKICECDEGYQYDNENEKCIKVSKNNDDSSSHLLLVSYKFLIGFIFIFYLI